MMRRTNLLLKILVPLCLLAALWILLRGGNAPAPSSRTTSEVANLTPEELRALGIDGDTPADTVATLVGQMKQYRQELNEVMSQNNKLTSENRRLREREQLVTQRISQAVGAEREARREQLEQQSSLLTQFEQQLRGLKQGNMPAGLGLEGESLPTKDDNLRWVTPQDARPAEKKLPHEPAVSYPVSFSAPGDDAETISESAAKTPAVEPVYTLPQNSTLTGSVAMTALLGRIPQNGSVTDPYPFKAVIGAENLIASGVTLPDVAGAVVSGTATGDWTLSCVRGAITSLTLVFHDGTVRTVPAEAEKDKSTDGIGWLSDPQGLSCIPGERKSNAGDYIASQFLLAGGAAAADAFASGESTTVVDGGSVTTAVTGNNGQYVLGQALGGGMKESADWFRQRYGQAFDAIYVPPGHPVAIHITRSLAIDYELKGRRVKYPATSANYRALE